jgi:hypothetical protein
VVEPEIGEHLLELTFAVDGAQELLLRELDDHAVRALLDRIWSLPAVARGCVGVLRVRLALPACLELRHLELLGDLLRAQSNRQETREPRGRVAVGDALRAQLLVEVSLDAELSHLLDVARARTETRTVEHVSDRLIILRESRGGRGDGNNCHDQRDHLFHCLIRPPYNRAVT